MTAGSKSSVVQPALEGHVPQLDLPIPMPLPPMEATRMQTLPTGGEWQFEPKWDGFRCLVFRHCDEVILQSKAGQPLSRYFPELVAAVLRLPHQSFVLDGEVVVFREGRISFDDLLLRIHPAASRVEKLATSAPACFMAFDLLHWDRVGTVLGSPLTTRRRHLERFFESSPNSTLIKLSPTTVDRRLASRWFEELGPIGLDGVVAKKRDERYRSGEREGMVKVKHMKTAECVVGGFRYGSSTIGSTKGDRGLTAVNDSKTVGSLLLGLYDGKGLLHFVGFTASFTRDERKAVKAMVEPLKGGAGFTGKAPGGPSRWTRGQPREWERLDPVLVCEVEYDYFSEARFRHGTKFLRWRPDKPATLCRFDQVDPPVSPTDLTDTFLAHGRLPSS